MILRYMLPLNIEKAVSLEEDEKIYYALPVDIDEDGKWTDKDYLVVTTRKIYIFRGEEKKIYNIGDFESVMAEPGIGGGILTGRYRNVETVLVHYSSKHL